MERVKRPKQTLQWNEYKDVIWACKKMFIIITYWGNENSTQEYGVNMDYVPQKLMSKYGSQWNGIQE
jgi:hypothetical protein